MYENILRYQSSKLLQVKLHIKILTKKGLIGPFEIAINDKIFTASCICLFLHSPLKYSAQLTLVLIEALQIQSNALFNQSINKSMVFATCGP